MLTRLLAGVALGALAAAAAGEEQSVAQRWKCELASVRQRKGFAGIHSATDTVYSWKECADLIGAYFSNPPWGDVPIKVDSPNHPLRGMFKTEGFSFKDEIY